MSRWLTRAADISANGPIRSTDKTDESRVQIGDQGLSSVLSVPRPEDCQRKDELVAVLSVPRQGTSHEPSPIAAGDWYSRGWVWNEIETQTFLVRHNQFLGLGLPDALAEELADKLVARDRDGDDRRLCVECRHCRPGPRCIKQFAVLDVLQRCDFFAPTFSRKT